VTRIPADETTSFASWDMPEVKEGQIVKVEKLKERGPRGELINVAKEEIIYSSLTAAQLEDISNQAYEDVRQQAYQDGLKQGHQEGYQAGLDDGKKTIAQQAQQLNTAVANVFSYLQGQDDEVEQALVNVATCIASSVLRRELTVDTSHIRAVVQDAIALLPMNVSNLSVHLSEQDHQFLSNDTEIPEQWTLQIDRTLKPGGCRVSSEQSVVDYTLEQQFQQTVNGLIEKRFAQLSPTAQAVVVDHTATDPASTEPPDDAI
jgi:flagellar assembly protein FliH